MGSWETAVKLVVNRLSYPGGSTSYVIHIDINFINFTIQKCEVASKIGMVPGADGLESCEPQSIHSWQAVNCSLVSSELLLWRWVDGKLYRNPLSLRLKP